MKEVKSYLCADLNAKLFNEEMYEKEIKKNKNPYIKFLYTRQHPFFKIIKGEEVSNNGGKESFFIFTFLHKSDPHNIYLNLVVESVNIKKATLVFTTRFRASRFQYNAMLKSVTEYFTNNVSNKRSRLIESKLIGSDRPMFSLDLNRVFHNKETWFSLISNYIFLDWQPAFGILHDLMVESQKLGKKYFDGTEI